MANLGGMGASGQAMERGREGKGKSSTEKGCVRVGFIETRKHKTANLVWRQREIIEGRTEEESGLLPL